MRKKPLRPRTAVQSRNSCSNSFVRVRNMKTWFTTITQRHAHRNQVIREGFRLYTQWKEDFEGNATGQTLRTGRDA